jgi:hypothetical protein
MKDKNQQNNKINRPKRAKAAETKIDADAKEVIRKAMISSLEEKLANTNVIKKDLNALSNVVEEFLASFIILGYTFEGDPVHCISAHNQQEADSLVTLINKFFHTHLNDENSEQG